MKRLFEIVTDHIGESYVRSYAWADSPEDAERLFRESFPALEVMRVEPLFWQHAGTFVTNPSDSGWQVSKELAAILQVKPNDRDVPDDERTRKLRFAISDCEAYCRGVTREISKEIVELVAKALRARLNAEQHCGEPISAERMAWQDEPSEDGMCYVEGCANEACRVYSRQGEWYFTNPFGSGREPVNGRRVCPIPAPPALSKRGEE